MSEPIVLPATGRIAAIDYGRKRIGIAICDTARIIASPLPFHAASPEEEVEAAFFRRLVVAEEIVGFVVGLPVHADGTDSRMSVEVERFGAWLAAATGQPVAFHDERYTSVEAAGKLAGLGLSRGKKKARTDSIAAQILLTAWLEARASGTASARPGALDG